MKSQKTKLKESETNKAWYKANRDHAIKQSKKYKTENKDKVKAYQKAYRRNRYATDPQYKLACSLRSRLGGAIKNIQKTGSAVKDLGCSIEDLIKHIESKFSSGMNWYNYGKWELDHIKPISEFDLTDRVQFLEACHYSNLQPLWKRDNIRKSNGKTLRNRRHPRKIRLIK